MGLAELPPELVHTYILPEFTWNNLLRLRRVCQRTKHHVDGYIRENGGIPNRVEIIIQKTGFYTFENFLNLGFQASRFYLCNLLELHEPDLFENEHASKFLKLYGSQVTQLRVQQMYTNPSATVLNFYEALTNLNYLEIECLGRYDKYPRLPRTLAKHFNYLQWFKHDEMILPKSFQNLKALQLTQRQTPPITMTKTRSAIYNCQILYECNNISSIMLGYVPSDNDKTHTCQLIRLNFLSLEGHFWRNSKVTGLKYVDLKNFDLTPDVLTKISPDFLALCHQFSRFNVKVKNVPVQILSAYNPMVHEQEWISNVVVSMSGISKVVLGMELEKLETLNLFTMLNISFDGASAPYFVNWPALEGLTLYISSTKVDWVFEKPTLSVVELFDILFESGLQRPLLKCLDLEFSSRMYNTLSKDLSTFPYPCVDNLVSCCPNLTTLCITGWPDKNNINFAKLWTGLVNLKVVWLSACKLLSDVGFIGEDESRPTFLELKRLNMLHLCGLHKMPLITDKTFSLIFKNLKVSTFVIESDKPLKNVTKKGIESLLTGSFAECIENFPFDNWSLENMNDLEFAVLKNKFRSSCKM